MTGLVVDREKWPQIKVVRVEPPELELVFEEGEPHEALAWEIADDVFGKDGWHVGGYGRGRLQLEPLDADEPRFSMYRYLIRGGA